MKVYLIGFCVLCALLTADRPARAGWGEDALAREAGYICDCSYSEAATNHLGISPSADAYGAINDIRIAGDGPNWVQTTEAAVGAIGLMQAAQQLKLSGQSTQRYDTVLDRFFHRWVIARGQCRFPSNAEDERGAFTVRCYYDKSGTWQRNGDANSGATGAMICAMWKYYEYLTATGRGKDAIVWLREAMPVAKAAGGFLRRQFEPAYNLEHSSRSLHNLWISDAVYAAAGLRCLTAWSQKLGAPDLASTAQAHKLALGILAMRDHTGNFFKYRDNKRGYTPTYGDSIDQLCFFPYQAGIVKPDKAAKSLSDFWTQGDGRFTMTPQTKTSTDWRYFGTRWHYYFDGRASNDYLYPGPGLQLALVEWRAGATLKNKTLTDRASRRFEWANGKDKSSLWFGVTAQTESGVPNGIVDWRDGRDYGHTAPLGDRFVDTSAYFIQATLAICWKKESSYLP